MGDGLLRISEVATRSGVSAKALRLYEARRIVPKPRRTPVGYRVYSPEVLGVLHFVTQARRLGLTLKEIDHIVALRCAKPGPCVHVGVTPVRWRVNGFRGRHCASTRGDTEVAAPWSIVDPRGTVRSPTP
jgi:hypothetical protein